MELVDDLFGAHLGVEALEGEADDGAAVNGGLGLRSAAGVGDKAWDSAETVRRDWLSTFSTRKTPPEGAEELITAAVLLADYNLSRAMTGNHQLLRTWLGLEPRTWQSPDQLPGYLSEVRTSKRQVMLSLAAVLAAWEEGLSRESWRQPNPWDARVLTTITGWGYQPSPVENLMITTDALTMPADDTAAARDADTA